MSELHNGLHCRIVQRIGSIYGSAELCGSFKFTPCKIQKNEKQDFFLQPKRNVLLQELRTVFLSAKQRRIRARNLPRKRVRSVLSRITEAFPLCQVYAAYAGKLGYQIDYQRFLICPKNILIICQK